MRTKAPQNGGIVTVTYKLPYTAYFLDYVQGYIDAYNEANPDAPMEYDMVGPGAPPSPGLRSCSTPS